jgi:LysM repeat protein
MTKSRKLTLVVALVAAVVMMLAFTSVSFAAGGTDDKGETVCIDGYVINHREKPVDGTKFDPQLEVEAVRVHSTDDAAAAGGSAFALVDEDGYFKFEDLREGDYNLMLQLPEDWEGIVPAAKRGEVAETGDTTFDAVDDEDDCYRVVFKIKRLFDVTVIKWEEALDGSVAGGKDWEITFTPVKDPFVKAQTKDTDANGAAVFTVAAGNWIVSEKVKPGWKPITPAKVNLELDQYAPPGAMDPVIFKNLEPPCKAKIEVYKLGYGTDPNGGEVFLGPLAGWKVTLARADNAMPPTTKGTDGMGKVTFDKLYPGVYKITEEVQKGWEALGDETVTVVIQDCEEVSVTFENKEITGDLRIYGHKYFKAWEKPYKGDHVGLAGWKMTATLVGSDPEIYVETTTNALGEYEFTEDMLEAAGMAFGGASIEVCEEERDNWIAETDECVTVKFPYPVPSDYDGVKVDFVNYQDPPMPGTGATSAGASCASTVTVARGDTLSGIAARTGSTVSAIASANGLQNVNHILAGQALCVP